MILLDKAPGVCRPFAGEDFGFIDKKIWQDARAEARSREKREAAPELFGSDIDQKVLAYAKENAERAGVARVIRFFEADAREIKKPTPDRRGTVVCNPPYGERMLTPAEVEKLYADVGRAFAKLDPWQIYVLTSHPHFERFFGRRADRVRRLYNGMIPCDFYQFFKPAAARKT